jgi:hypothetical protein
MERSYKDSLTIPHGLEDLEFPLKPICSTAIVLESQVRPLNENLRILFLVITIVVAFFAFIGNLLVLYVNFSR